MKNPPPPQHCQLVPTHPPLVAKNQSAHFPDLCLVSKQPVSAPFRPPPPPISHCLPPPLPNNSTLLKPPPPPKSLPGHVSNQNTLTPLHTTSQSTKCTIYIENFPDRIDGYVMRRTMSRYGAVLDVFISKKLTTKGRRFGFVRFDEPVHKDLLEDVRKTWFGSYKIRANFAKFARNQPKNQQGEMQPTGYHTRRSFPRKMTDERPYSTVLKGVSKVDGGQKKQVQEKKCLEVKVEDTRDLWLQRSAVGYLHDFEALTNMKNILRHGEIEVKATPMGGHLVLLTFTTIEEMMKVLAIGHWLGEWFRLVKQWSPQQLDNERFAWLRFSGVPLHVWNNRTFAQMGGLWGNYVTIDESTLQKKRFDIGRVLITTMEKTFIMDEIKLLVGNDEFMVQVIEEPNHCLFSTPLEELPVIPSGEEKIDHGAELTQHAGSSGKEESSSEKSRGHEAGTEDGTLPVFSPTVQKENSLPQGGSSPVGENSNMGQVMNGPSGESTIPICTPLCNWPMENQIGAGPREGNIITIQQGLKENYPLLAIQDMTLSNASVSPSLQLGNCSLSSIESIPPGFGPEDIDGQAYKRRKGKGKSQMKRVFFKQSLLKQCKRVAEEGRKQKRTRRKNETSCHTSTSTDSTDYSSTQYSHNQEIEDTLQVWNHLGLTSTVNDDILRSKIESIIVAEVIGSKAGKDKGKAV